MSLFPCVKMARRNWEAIPQELDTPIIVMARQQRFDRISVLIASFISFKLSEVTGKQNHPYLNSGGGSRFKEKCSNEIF